MPIHSGREEAMKKQMLTKRIFPQKTDLATNYDEALNKVLYDINHRPRKCLAYRTACEALMDEFE